MGLNAPLISGGSETMKIKALKILRGPNINANIGDIITIEDKSANELILAGAAEKVAEVPAKVSAEPAPETKEEPAPETKEEPKPEPVPETKAETKETPVPVKETPKKKR